MADTTRTIDMRMTWRMAAQIIAAALENGTGAGREAARAELFRMAEILDAMNDQQREAAEAQAEADRHAAALDSISADADLYFERHPDPEADH